MIKIAVAGTRLAASRKSKKSLGRIWESQSGALGLAGFARPRVRNSVYPRQIQPVICRSVTHSRCTGTFKVRLPYLIVLNITADSSWLLRSLSNDKKRDNLFKLRCYGRICLLDFRNDFCVPAHKASVSGIEDFLVLPAFFSRGRKPAFAFKRVGKGIEHGGISGSIGDSFRFHHLTIAKQLNVDWALYSETIVGK